MTLRNHGNRRSHTLRRLLTAVATLAFPTLSTIAQAQDNSPARPTGSEETSGIVVRTDLLPDANPPAGVLDNLVNVTGVGQIAIRPSQATTGLGVCSGTLINPRTVIFASHCVNTQAASTYGTNIAGGNTAISVGFQADNRPAVRQWLGLASVTGGTDANPALRNATNTARDLYAIEQVWYDPRSLDLGPGLNFLQADIALGTLDTPASDIPTWTLLFSPLTSETHGIVNGYGARGTNGTSGANLGVDFRRRVAENVISALYSLDDRNNFLFGPDDPFFVQSLYQLDFDDPAGEAAFDGVTRFDFDIFDGGALPREGTTAGGDSGGPLIADQAFAKPVVVGVLSGGSRFFGPQPFSSYGTTSFYQPLFLYWDQIVANNPYKYVTNLAGSRDWSNPAHWVQTIDPNYAVVRDGQLVNALPGAVGQALSTDTTKFGSVCFLSDCLDLSRTGPENAGTGNGLVVPGGPGSVNFVPNNVRADTLAGINSRYYDVTLSASGTTSVTSPVTIDRLTIDGATKLDVKSNGTLGVLGDFTQAFGWTNVDGRLNTGEAFVASGILSGSGTIDPTYLTVANAFVVPGGDGKFGTLTVRGDLVLTSATTLVLDVSRDIADRLNVVGDAQNTGIASLGGTVFLQKLGAAPRHGKTFTIVTTTGGIQNTFDSVLGKQGVLRPQLSYSANNVTVTLFADKLTTNLLSQGRVENAFASALDSLRSSSYSNLYGLYGAIDVLDAASLTGTLRNLNPTIVTETVSFTQQQVGVMDSLVSDRLSRLGTSRNNRGRLAIIGAPETLLLSASNLPVSQSVVAQRSFARQITPGAQAAANLPENMSGFISGGADSTASSFSDRNGGNTNRRQGWHMAMGLEAEFGSSLTVGTAFGHSEGRSIATGAQTETSTSQAAVYGSYQLGRGAYVAGLASISSTKLGIERETNDTVTLARLGGSTSALGYTTHLETGINVRVTKGMTFTPRLGVRYSAFQIDQLRETGGETALRLNNIKQNRLEGRAGVQLAGGLKLGGGWALDTQMQADYVRGVAGNPGSLTARFALADSFAFALPFGSRDSNWGEVKGGFKLTKGAFAIGAGVESDIGRSDYRDNRAVADFTVRF